MEPVYGMMLGAALKGTVVGFVKNAVGGVAGGSLVNISDDIIALGLGWYLQKKTKGTTKDVATGLMIAGGAGLAEGVFSGLPILGQTPAVAQTATPAAPTQEASLTAFVSGQ